MAEADSLLAGKVNYFSVHVKYVGNPPDWFLNPFHNRRHPQAGAYWSRIADFNVDAGDIKITWELSRFTWAPLLARAWRLSRDSRYLSALYAWIQDWWRCNPPYAGPNWMCAQESSIRLANTLLAMQIAGIEEKSKRHLVGFVEAHCKRIALTIPYAVAQDNNHATSEGMGLFLGGTWLARTAEGDAKRRGQQWAKRGCKLLERAVRRLILPDGSFSQYSLTYHRMVLDTLSIVEVWRERMKEAAFSCDFYAHAAAATRWLDAMIDVRVGDGPNLGANDGTYPYRLGIGSYRDFRPCLQLASILFLSQPALERGVWDEPAAWLGVSDGRPSRPRLNGERHIVFQSGGYVLLSSEVGARVLVRAPNARFRPAHADALHVDLWWKGQNLLRDGGTYSYADSTVGEALSGSAGHNVGQFDDHDQMPKLGRFLYGAWIHVSGPHRIVPTENGLCWEGSYRDLWGAQHKRKVSLGPDALSVRDEVRGFKRKAVFRWRLAPQQWAQKDGEFASSVARIRVESSVTIRRMNLEVGWESLYYLEKSQIPILEVEIDQSPAVLVTTVTLL